MARLEVKLTSLVGQPQIPAGTEVAIAAKGTVTVQTPSGQVYVSHDETAGMTLVTVRGEKGSTTIKFNEKAVA
jgi:hypothetical protein